ncbi:esterase [Pararhizobium polonicum]|uniref:Esterase n=1 Tax=Pararhizobium polonicum TaxID=1612624 RepID=A0A1C7P088_9HYPH|nr:alpha/beta hydrolase [Pararhizobium polonicum]OBZ94649.1 esterase [Pararhizobium polonicum]
MARVADLQRDDAELCVFDGGEGQPVVFQHGLGGDEAQVAQAFPDGSGQWRRLTVECRGHGGSSLGTRPDFSIAMFADDVLAIADRQGIRQFVAGGISMGAAVALHLAHAFPNRVTGLILVRPAWTFAVSPVNMAPIREIAELIRSNPLERARALFVHSETARRLSVEAPDNFASLLGYFDRPNAVPFAGVLAGIAADGPGVSKANAAALSLPALVIGNAQDAVHPLDSARLLADTLPHARFVEVAAKATDKTRHLAETREAIDHFLMTHFKNRSLVTP